MWPPPPPAGFCFPVPTAYPYHVLLFFSSLPHSFCLNFAVALLWPWLTLLYGFFLHVLLFFFLGHFSLFLSTLLYEILERGNRIDLTNLVTFGCILGLWPAYSELPRVKCHPLSSHPRLPEGCLSVDGCSERGPLTLRGSHLVNVSSPHAREE